VGRLFVTGAEGMLGRRVVEEARERGHDVIAAGRAQLDITDAQAVFDAIGEVGPDAVVNCAAYTDVDGAESDEQTAMRVNADGANHVAAAAGRNGAFVVAVSTDYVFAGDAERPYVESDAIAPATAYGRTKAAGEAAVLSVGTPCAIARTAWLYGAGGRNFVDTMLALAAQREEVSVVADQVGCPTWTGHLAPALVEVSERRLEGIHHLAAAGSCSWYELAVELFARAGVDCQVVPTMSAELRRPAPRPAWSVLGSERADAIALPAWQDGLAAYLRERVAV
jgi:dTDP-4-dehydrorhamnose reductase